MRVPLCGLTVPGYIFVLKLVPQDKPYFWSLHQSLFPPPLFAFFSSKIRKMPLNFEISKVLKCPSMLGLPALHSWLLAVFRVRCKLLGTAWSPFRPLAPYFLPFLRSLFQRGWPQKQLFSCAPAQAHQSFTDFSRWPDMLPRLSLFPLFTGITILLGTEPTVWCKPSKHSTKELPLRPLLTAHWPCLSHLFTSSLAHLSSLAVGTQ